MTNDQRSPKPYDQPHRPACHPERSVYPRAAKDLRLQERSICGRGSTEVEILRCAEYGCAQDDMLGSRDNLWPLGHWNFFGHCVIGHWTFEENTSGLRGVIA